MHEEASNCHHIERLLASNDAPALDRFRDVVGWSVNYERAMSNPAKRRKLSNRPICDTCRVPLARPITCLQCSYSGCWSHGHIRAHLKGSGHQFGVDPSTGSLYCLACNDFVYNSRAEALYADSYANAIASYLHYNDHGPPIPWIPTERDYSAISAASAVICEGRRGLLNLGQTCFMNVVLQSFVHNPLLRNYFLGDMHDRRICAIADCTSCEMDSLFSEIYSDEPSPYGPIGFLVTTWRGSAELAGYAQQDAHEFFISTLNQIHASSPGASPSNKCPCIVHRTFAGQLQSEVRCGRCGNVTLTVDPMFDVSLELRGAGENTLFDCLRRFTHPEKLWTKEYSCERCGKNGQEASKRMSIRRLPPVLSFQFKRFEQNMADKGAVRKIEASVRFPATLDMSPYTTRAMRQNAGDGPTRLPDPPGTYVYDLFAVINHEGQMNNGHYTNFARYGREWYRFDDDKVTNTSLATVLASAAYMCFYVKRRLDYKDGGMAMDASVPMGFDSSQSTGYDAQPTSFDPSQPMAFDPSQPMEFDSSQPMPWEIDAPTMGGLNAQQTGYLDPQQPGYLDTQPLDFDPSAVDPLFDDIDADGQGEDDVEEEEEYEAARMREVEDELLDTL
ncbi:hypothetical protein EV714DRAFT_207029 [Schizophyllum commune]